MNDPKYEKLKARNRRSATKAIVIVGVLVVAACALAYWLLF
jgi:hypothetical protein